MTRGRPPGESDDLDGFMDEVRAPATAILLRFGIAGDRAVEVLTALWLMVHRTEVGRAEKKRQFLEALENACGEIRAKLGPPEEEDDAPQVH